MDHHLTSFINTGCYDCGYEKGRRKENAESFE